MKLIANSFVLTQKTKEGYKYPWAGMLKTKLNSHTQPNWVKYGHLTKVKHQAKVKSSKA